MPTSARGRGRGSGVRALENGINSLNIPSESKVNTPTSSIGRGRGRGVLKTLNTECCKTDSLNSSAIKNLPSTEHLNSNYINIVRAPGQNGDLQNNVFNQFQTKSNYSSNMHVAQNGTHNNNNNNENTSNQSRGMHIITDSSKNINQPSPQSTIDNTRTNHQSGLTNGNVKANQQATQVTSQSQQQKKDNLINTASVKEGQKLMVKYNYTANPASPGGFKELSIKQTENIYFVSKTAGNPYWWQVRNERGEVGYAPAAYCLVIENQTTSLPWLEEKRKAELAEKAAQEAKQKEQGSSGFGVPEGRKSVPQAYVSAYGQKTAAPSNREHYCDICDKQLNGPIPYKAHIYSKAHKEEVEMVEKYGK